MAPIFCPVCGKEVPTHKLVYDARERRIAGYRCACGFIHAAGLDPEDLARMGWMEGYRQQCREMKLWNGEGGSSLFWGEKKSEPLQAADCSWKNFDSWQVKKNTTISFIS